MTTAICAIARNEGPYLLEWVAYQRVLGFGRVLIYENNSTDYSAALLERLQALGVLEYVPWPITMQDDDRYGPQLRSYADSFTHLGDCAWIAFFDLDEFLVLHRHASITEFLADFEDRADCLAVNWQVFGSSGLQTRSAGLVIERFLRRGETQWTANRHFKAIVRPTAISTPFFTNSHTPNLTPEARFVYTDGTPVPDEPLENHYIDGLGFKVTIEAAQLNHYFTKSRAEWCVKRDRGRSDLPPSSDEKFRSDHYFVIHDRNEVEDPCALKYVSAVRTEMARLQGLLGPGPWTEA
jgi:hypothetical protein